MKTKFPARGKDRSGYALVMTLFMAALAVVVLAATLGRTSGDANMNDRNNQYVASQYAAESAVEKVIARMKYDYLNGNDSYVTNNLNIYRAYVPTASEDSYWGNFQFSDGQGNPNQTFVSTISNRLYTPLQSQYYGLNGFRTVYRVLSNARQTSGRFVLTNAVQEDVELDSIPVFQFAIFYNGLLEFTWAAPLTVNGRTHANGNIFVGSSQPLTFNATVTTTGFIFKTNWDGHTTGEYSGTITYNGNPGYSTNVQALQLPIGTTNTASAVREIINMPPSGEDPNSALGLERYYNKAGVVLLVSNSTVTAMIKNSPSDTATLIQAAYYPTNYSPTNYTQIANNFPFLSVTNNFTDQREGKTIKASQVDIGKYSKWLITNSSVLAKFPSGSGTFPNILYLADNRTNASTELLAVRLTNSAVIPTNMASSGQASGFTLATPNPLYVWGNYNCPDSTALGTTNTTKTFPSSLASDALTILSSAWADSLSSSTLNSRNAAVSTTINAALLTGVVYSTGSSSSQFSGGVMNLPRLLEDWGNGGAITLTLNTSMVNFYDSVKAIAQFQNPGVYYYAPSRKFSFDLNFTDPTKLPPGTPMLGVILRSRWTVPPPNTTTYAGP